MGNDSEKADTSDAQGAAEPMGNGKGQDVLTPDFNEEERAIEKK